ncbi:TauD/TfdA family dioxygenase [Aliikangiella coralliicola]|nr:TauD/TfdA family dioxygenase [Aliikangiella coralliicola]
MSNDNKLDLLDWLTENESLWKKKLHTDGAVLFRGFSEFSASQVSLVLNKVCKHPLEYKERSSPRTKIDDKVYTSTDYPSHQEIFFHNENSYQSSWPKVLMFYCRLPAQCDGRTPIADMRRVFDRIPQPIKENFHKRKVKYVRNFSPTHGLTWQDVFQLEDKKQVEDYCRKQAIDFKWKDESQLEITSVREAILRHPETQSLVWFNHAAFFHVSTLGEELSKNLLDYYGQDNLPNQTYYGDGEPIEDEVIATIRGAYEAERITFDWNQGDVLLVDNMLFSHARETYSGNRTIWVGMGELCYSKKHLVDSLEQ